MILILKRAVIVLVFASVCAVASDVEARHPSYVLLRGPASPVPHQPTYGYYPGHAVQVVPRTYSYGWFGAKPRRQWTRHSGYYNNYRQWTAR